MITLDGKTLKELGLIPLKEHLNPILPATQDMTLDMPEIHGLYHFNSKMGSKSFSIPVLIAEDNRNEVQTVATNLAAFLLDQYARPREIELKFIYEPDKFYKVKFTGQIDPERYGRLSNFVLPFTAYDPFKYAIVYAEELTWGNEELTFESMYTFGNTGTDGTVTITSPTSLNAYVEGYAIKPIIEISGSADNLTVTNGEQSFSMPSFSNVIWTIDCQSYTVKKYDANGFNDVRLREFILQPGSNEIKVDGTNINITMRIKYRDKWM